jgi:hypothetical protein
MFDAEMDFHAYVAAAYELRSADELPVSRAAKYRAWHFGLRYLVPVGNPRLVRPRRKALDFAVGLLLRTPKPPLTSDEEDRKKEIPNADEVAHLERNSLAIAKHIGLLKAGRDPENSYSSEDNHESLLSWLQLAQSIQLMFDGPPGATELGVGRLAIYLAYKPDKSRSMAVRPESTREVLIYHAAQMIAKGTESRTCEHCGTTFLSGGTGRGKDKKRGDARFCSDECRWKFHNESRRRAR